MVVSSAMGAVPVGSASAKDSGPSMAEDSWGVGATDVVSLDSLRVATGSLEGFWRSGFLRLGL